MLLIFRILVIFFAISFASGLSADGWRSATPSEWKYWPEYCKARSATIDHHALAKTVSQTTIKKWKKILGSLFPHMHHYCAGFLWLQEIKLGKSKSPMRKTTALRAAMAETYYTYRFLEPNSVLYSEIAGNHAQALYYSDRFGEAAKVLQNAIAVQPKKYPAYIRYAAILKKQGDLETAIKILNKGLANIDGKSSKTYRRKAARIFHVKLARIYLDKNDYQSAKPHVNKAYDLGYRSTKLRKKLKKLRKK